MPPPPSPPFIIAIFPILQSSFPFHDISFAMSQISTSCLLVLGCQKLSDRLWAAGTGRDLAWPGLHRPQAWGSSNTLYAYVKDTVDPGIHMADQDLPDEAPHGTTGQPRLSVCLFAYSHTRVFALSVALKQHFNPQGPHCRSYCGIPTQEVVVWTAEGTFSRITRILLVPCRPSALGPWRSSPRGSRDRSTKPTVVGVMEATR